MTATFTETHHDINGIDTVVLTAGPEGAEPVMFLHGAGTASGFEWLLPVAEQFRLVVPYHPGFGLSGDPALPGPEHLARHHLDVLGALGVDRFHLVGQSMGGWTAATLASFVPERLLKLVLVAPAGLDVPDHPTVDLTSVPPAELPGYLTVDVERIFGPADAPPPPPEFIAARVREGASLATMLAGGQFHDTGVGRWLHRIDVPTLVLWGEADRLIPFGQSAVWAAGLPRASVHGVPGAGHLLFEERAEAATIVADFLRG